MESAGNFWPIFNQLLLTVACAGTILNGFGIIYLIARLATVFHVAKVIDYERIADEGKS